MSEDGKTRSGATTAWIAAAALLLVLAAVPLVRSALHLGRTAPPAALRADGDAQIKARAGAAVAAAQKFLGKAGDSFQSGNPPRQTGAAVAPLLATIFDVDALEAKRLAEDDAVALADWLEADVQVGSVYALAGTGITDMSKVPDDPKVLAQIDRNVATYAPEVGRFMDTMIIIDGLMAHALTGASTQEGNAKFKAGIDLVRAGMAKTIGGALRTIAGNGLAADWRRDRIATLRKTAPKLAIFLSQTQCSEIRKTAKRVAPTLHAPDAEKELDAFRAALTC